MDVENSKKFNYKKIEHETEKAWQVVFDPGQVEWFPKSQCRIDKAKNEIFIPQWLVDDEDLSNY